MTTHIEKSIESMKQMMESMYCYHQLEREGYFFDKYLKKYEEYLGDSLFNKTYDEFSKYLKDTYKIVSNVYTDAEGCTYNQLITKEDGE